MKRILLIALFLLAMVGTVSAYQFYLTCPESVQSGLPLKCTIDSNFPPGTTFTFALYHSTKMATQIKKQSVTIQADKKTQYIVIDTQGLPGGNYKAEIQTINADEERFSSDSTLLQLITIIDRSGDIEITSPITQDLKDALRIEGKISKAGNDGVEIEVNGPDGRIFGPQWIQTKEDIRDNAGIFTQKLNVNSKGEYTVDFSDTDGYIGTRTFTVIVPTTSPTTVPMTTPVKTSRPPTTTAPTPLPTTEQSPLSLFTMIGSFSIAGMLVLLMDRRVR